MYKRTGLVSFTLTALALAMASERLQAADIANIEHVDVVGQAAAIDQALKEQRSSDSIKSVVHADGVAQLPDENVAEAVQRLPGVSVERDQGEGRFVSVRGLGPDLNSVTINGTLVPSPESERRAVALDVLPSELVQSLSVIKTLTPDMDANSLGGTVDVKSLSAFDHKGLFYTGSTEASYDKNTRQTSPKFSGAASNRFSLGDGIDNFGVAAALSWQKRDFGSDNVETGGAWDFSQGAKLSEFEQRDYDISRERAGGGLNFDYKPDDLSSYYLRTLYSRYTDTETRNAASLEFADPQAPGELGVAEGKRKLKNREETQEIQSYVFGGERRSACGPSAARSVTANPAKTARRTSPAPPSMAATLPTAASTTKTNHARSSAPASTTRATSPWTRSTGKNRTPKTPRRTCAWTWPATTT